VVKLNVPTYEQVSAITQQPVIVAYLIMTYVLFIFAYLIIACTTKGKSGSGKATSKPMIAYENSWIPLVLWGFGQAILFLLIIFPVWLRLFN
jgi:hypothetical protein